MKKLMGIFSALVLITPACGSAFRIELEQLLARMRNHKKSEQSPPEPLQTRIEKDKKRFAVYFSSQFDQTEPLPFVMCTSPALCDIAKSHKNNDLIELAFSNQSFDPSSLRDPRTGNNLFHVCAQWGTIRFLASLLKHCQEHHINYEHLINAKNGNGMTPLGLATKFSRTKCIALLLWHAAQPRKQPGSLMHIAATANMRGETKRNKIVQLLYEYDKSLIAQLNANCRDTEQVAQLQQFVSTQQLIQKYKAPLIKTLGKKPELYFSLLPDEIFDTSVRLAFDPLSLKEKPITLL